MEFTEATGQLFVVATPIGNLEDITLRALRVLKEADLIAAEDTRHTRKLLAHFDIHTPLAAFHEHSTDAARDRLLARLLAGETIALVTDAGTPGVSDPGHELVNAAIAEGVPVTPIPGASAVLSALVGSGLPMDRFRFEGFLPRRTGERKAALAALAGEPETMVFYEAPHRLTATLRALAEAFGPRPACAARELTKVHEEFIRASLGELVGLLPDPIRGEWTIVVSGAGVAPRPAPETDTDWRADLARRLAAGESSRDASRAVAEAHGLRRKDVYAAAIESGES